MSFTKINHYEKEYADTHHDTALNVTEGVEDQPIVSPYFTRRKKRRLSTDEYVEGILAGNITTLSQAITLVESNNPAHYAQAQEIIERCLPHAGKSVRIGITGVPGAGKSTFIEAIGNMVTSLRHKLAVLAIDPSSRNAAGFDPRRQTRMENISGNPDVFIRPSPSAGSLGGVAQDTRDDHPVRSRGLRRGIHRDGGRRAVGDGRALDGRHVHAVADFGCRRRVTRASSAASWRWPTSWSSPRPTARTSTRPNWPRPSSKGHCGCSPCPNRAGGPKYTPARPWPRRGSKRYGKASRSSSTTSGQRLFPPQPQPPEQILDVRVDQRSAAQLVLPRPGGRNTHRGVRKARTGGQNIVVHRRQELLDIYFKRI